MKNQLLICLLIFFKWQLASAAVKLPAIFSDGMVLQQKSNVIIWGWADAGEKVAVSQTWNEKIVYAFADASGKWQATIKTPAAGGPFTLVVKANNTIQLNDVLVGEVWLCSGQSNMAFTLKSSEGGAEEVKNADDPSIRYFSVKRQYGHKEFEDCPGSVWEKPTPQNAGNFSAVAYYFAKKIHHDVNVPVGIIYNAWGGTPAEAWTPLSVINDDSILQRYMQRWSAIQNNVGKDSMAYHKALEDWEKLRTGADSNKIKKPTEPQTLYYFNRPWREPSVLFNGMVVPVIPFCIKGILWYQGESNVAYANEYTLLLSRMITSWRQRWRQHGMVKDLPFYLVQIAPYGYNNLEQAAQLRQAQEEVSRKVKNTAMVVTVDLGNMDNIHFTRKREVGERLALIALHNLYGFKNLKYSIPAVKKIRRLDKQVEIEFDQPIQTLNDANPSGFEIGYRNPHNDSLIFERADAVLRGNKIIVGNESAARPLIVRYAWVQIGSANLINKEGFPVAPFSKKLNH